MPSMSKVNAKIIDKGIIKRTRYRRKYRLNLDEMLDIANLVDKSLKGERVTVHYSPRVINYADHIVKMSKDPILKEKADRVINQLNRKIVLENKRTCNMRESEIIFKKFMMGK